MRERRATIRVPVGVDGTCQVLKGLAAPQLILTDDLSLGGIRFTSASRLEPGDPVQVSFSLPAQGQVEISGSVVWCRDYSRQGQAGFISGIRWTEIQPSSQARLNAFLTEYTRANNDLQISSVRIPPPVNTIAWTRAIVLGVALFTVLTLGAILGFSWFQMKRESNSLRQTLQAYRQIIDKHERIQSNY